MMRGPAVRMRGIRKRLGAAEALRGADFAAEPGAITAIIGENGAGKTTLMRVLFGLIPPDAGEIEVGGKRMPTRYSTADGIGIGMGMLQQHGSLIPSFTVLENVVLGAEPRRGLRLDRAGGGLELRELLDELGGGIDPDLPASRLTVAQGQLVEIARMRFTGARLLIFDEPTTVLAPPEIARFYRVLSRLAREGATIIVITHRLHEVMEHAAAVTVLRRGEVTARFAAGEFDEQSLVAAMVPDAGALERKTPPAVTAREPALELSGAEIPDAAGAPFLREVSLQVRPGEILGIAGITGSGQRELAEVLAGLRRPLAGSVRLSGTEVTREDIVHRRRRGLIYIPEDRHADGIIPPFALTLNRLLGDQREPDFHASFGFRTSRLRADVEDKIARYDIAAPGPDAAIESLSGGNQQKFLLARELDRGPRVIIAHGPTRGLDIAAAARCYDALRQLCKRGAAIVLFSTELEDLLAISHRVGVLFAGRLIDAGDSAGLDIGQIGLLMTRGQNAAPGELS